MKTEEKILTLHPQGKKGVNISLKKYLVIKEFILNLLQNEQEITFEKMIALAENELSATFDGKVGWYVVSVKLDLEARKIIERIPKTSPHKLKLCQ
ncbi:MAG: hypothetical protein IPM47_01650 [Sphingobacteriales bacterium]|nr:MAG: hypothetical protein IPM47_01650 [Sphingobacteriales bacterium]